MRGRRRSPRAISALLTTLALLGLSSPTVVARERAVAPGCSLLHVTSPLGAATTLRRVTLSGMTTEELPQPPGPVETLGYSAEQGKAYGLSSTGTFPFRGTRVITVDPQGTTHDLGPLRDLAPRMSPPRTGEIRAGAVDGYEWYLVTRHRLYTVDIDPDSATYLSVTHVTWLAPRLVPLPIGDLAATSDGTLLTVTTNHQHEAVLLELAVDNGTVVSTEPVALPPARYGAIVITDDGGRYVVADNVAGHSRFYRIGADPAETAELARGRPLHHNDAAGCLPAAPQPTPPPSTTSPRPPSTPPETTTPSPPTETPPEVTTQQPPTNTPSRSSTPRPPPSSRPPSTSVPQSRPPNATALPVPTQRRPVRPLDTETKRQWVLATLLLIIGSGVVLRRLR
ncbi:hypothetical protein SAMN04487819_106160 [Actinopolyspora alba]|uniref:Uncharacterized protein n=1 Tax=Actinopolyspora alba TaxID=673379 RepID=A0A1I1WWN3_9ACTN|nr:hypothetical protein [Actinopolyspora alba]SFD99547.1 hypothetical protein SAMN04487819_106160 [Actinopolyspora alba]